MPAKTITLSQKDQDLLRLVFANALAWQDFDRVYRVEDKHLLVTRIKELKERLV